MDVATSTEGQRPTSGAQEVPTASEQRVCHLCNKGLDTEPHRLGKLIGPYFPDKSQTGRQANKAVYLHQQCALWSPEVFFDANNQLRRVAAALRRGRANRCFHCSERGATLGCRVERCKASYHLPCARAVQATFYDAKYLIACPKHAPWFQNEQTPQQQRKIKPSGAWPSPMRQPGIEDHDPSISTPQRWAALQSARATCFRQAGTHKRKRGAVDAEEYVRAAREAYKHYKAEERTRAQMPSDDEESFQRKERRRLDRDTARLDPVILGSDSSGQNAAPAFAAGWESVGGLTEVVKQLKEMVLLPLLYPELFHGFHGRPPGGILFHGPPGCGKTLAVRALAGACAAVSPTPVALFARRGADCLGKWSGDAERTLRLLFEEASRRAPAIIFLDELDGLVPARAARQGGADQVFASVVSTLLALLDGLHDRGHVVVIGATNRPEAVDPALRRPGRFDREVYFALPNAEDRAAILRVHTRSWPAPPSEEEMQALADATPGWAGADLKALCASAVLAAVRRSCPTSLEQLEAAVQHTEAGGINLQGPAQDSRRVLGDDLQVSPQDWQAALAGSAAPCSLRVGLAGLSAPAASPLPAHLVPLLLPGIGQAACCLSRQAWPLSPQASLAAAIAVAQLRARSDAARSMCSGSPRAPASNHGQGLEALDLLEHHMRKAGAIAASPGHAAAGSSGQPADAPAAAATASAPGPRLARPPPAARLLLAGRGDCGQAHSAAAVLCLLGPGQAVHRVALPQLVAGPAGGTLAGACASQVQEAVLRARAGQEVVFFLPHLHAWAGRDAGGDELHDTDASEGAVEQEPARAGHHVRRGFGNLHQVPSETVLQQHSVTSATSQHRQEAEIEQPGVGPSEAFAAFIQLVQQASSHPILVVATSQRPAEELPEEVQAFFNGPPKPATPSMGVVAVRQATSEAWGATLTRTMHGMATELAATGVQAVESALLRLHEQRPQRHINGRSQHLAPRDEQASAAYTPVAADDASTASLPLNEADCEAAQRLCSQLDLNIRGCGSWLQQDSRTRHARPPPRAKRRDWQMPPPPPPASLPGVASSAAKGEFRGDVDRFMAAVREGVALVKQAQARKGSNSSRAALMRATAAGCALSDELESWAAEVDRHYNLQDPWIRRLLTHALSQPPASYAHQLSAVQRDLFGEGGALTPGGMRGRRFEQSDSSASDDSDDDVFVRRSEQGAHHGKQWQPAGGSARQGTGATAPTQQMTPEHTHSQHRLHHQQLPQPGSQPLQHELQAPQADSPVTTHRDDETSHEGMQPARQLSLSPQDSQYLKERLTGLLEAPLQAVGSAQWLGLSRCISLPAFEALVAKLWSSAIMAAPSAASCFVEQLVADADLQQAACSGGLCSLGTDSMQSQTEGSNQNAGVLQLEQLLMSFAEALLAGL